MPSFSQWSSICRAIQYITRERRLFVSSYQSSAFAPDVGILFPLQLEVGTTVVIVFDGIGNDHYYGWSQFLVLPTVFAPNSTSIVFRSLCLCLPIHRMAVYARLCALLFSPNHPKSRSLSLIRPHVVFGPPGSPDRVRKNLTLRTTNGYVTAETWIRHYGNTESNRVSMDLSTDNGAVHATVVRHSLDYSLYYSIVSCTYSQGLNEKKKHKHKSWGCISLASPLFSRANYHRNPRRQDRLFSWVRKAYGFDLGRLRRPGILRRRPTARWEVG